MYNQLNERSCTDDFTDDQIKELIKQKYLKTAEDVQDMLKEMFSKTLEQMRSSII